MRLLLETHLPEAVVRQLQQHGLDAVALQHWRGGAYRRASDADILVAAYEDNRVLVTLDSRTIPPLLAEWAAMGRHHAGVVIVSRRTFPFYDIGRLLRALLRLHEQMGDQEWEDVTIFLAPA